MEAFSHSTSSLSMASHIAYWFFLFFYYYLLLYCVFTAVSSHLLSFSLQLQFSHVSQTERLPAGRWSTAASTVTDSSLTWHLSACLSVFSLHNKWTTTTANNKIARNKSDCKILMNRWESLPNGFTLNLVNSSPFYCNLKKVLKSTIIIWICGSATFACDCLKPKVCKLSKPQNDISQTKGF